MTAIITLTSDFDLNDGYVAAMKGVILGIIPDVHLIDICHSIEPQNILQAAFVLSTVHRCFPDGAIHLVVVDPGVGTERKGLILKTPRAYFVAPDNGVLTYVAKEHSSREGSLAPGVGAVILTNQEYWLSPVSSTFHGRDVFAPVAAHLSVGVRMAELGETATSVSMLSTADPQHHSDGSLTGAIIHIDHFGNLITNIKNEDIASAPEATLVEISGRQISGMNATYAQGQGLLALIGSNGYLEIAMSNGSACRTLSAGIGDEVKVKRR